MSEFNILKKVSMEEVAKQACYTDDKINYIIQCAKNALKNDKTIPENIEDEYCIVKSEYVLEKAIQSAIDFVKRHNLVENINKNTGVYQWKGSAKDIFKDSFLYEDSEKEENVPMLKVVYDEKDYLTIYFYNDEKNPLSISFKYTDLYDHIELGCFRQARVFINNVSCEAKSATVKLFNKGQPFCYAKVVYAF